MIQIFNDKDALYNGVSCFISDVVDKYAHINIALSGGNTPKALFDYWSSQAHDRISWKHLSFFWGDERCVPPDDEMSNYGMTNAHLFAKVPEIKQQQIHRICGELDPVAEAVRYGGVLEELLPQRNGLPYFDVMLLGLGNDGHTASIFPNQLEKWNSRSYCVVAEHPETGQKRISLTGQVINNARKVAFLVTGADKAQIVREVIYGDDKVRMGYPAAHVQPVSGLVHWFLDKEAAAELRP